MKNLSREELKNIFGGKVAAVPSCKTGGACTLTITGEGSTYTQAGQCEMMQTGTIVACWCNAGDATTPLSSNGGLSRCWN